MFFLLRAAFWLSLVVLLIPADPSETARPRAARSVSTFEAIGAAQSTFEDLRGFCSRNPSEAAAAPANPAAAPAHAAATPAHGAPAAALPVPLRASIVPMPAPRPLS